MTDPITVVLVDDHELIRQGLRRAFDRAADLDVVGEAGSVAEARTIIEAASPHVVVLDIRLGDGNGLELARDLRASDPQLGIVMLSMYGGDEYLFGALDAGASAFVPKDAPASDVVAAARHARATPLTFSAPNLGAAMQRRLNPTGPKLSPREREVLGLLAEGLGVAEISTRLFISPSTTKTHVGKVYEKLGASNRAQALMTALRMGLISSDAEQRL